MSRPEVFSWSRRKDLDPSFSILYRFLVSIPFTSLLRYKARKHRRIRRSRRVEVYTRLKTHRWKPIGPCGCRREVETQAGDYRPERVRRQYRSPLVFLS